MAARLAVTVDSVSGETSGTDTPFFDQEATTAVPEPSSILPAGVGLMSLLIFMRWKKTK
jgi:hypothetical protein